MVFRFPPCCVAISMLANLKLLSERIRSGTIPINGLDGHTLPSIPVLVLRIRRASRFLELPARGRELFEHHFDCRCGATYHTEIVLTSRLAPSPGTQLRTELPAQRFRCRMGARVRCRPSLAGSRHDLEQNDQKTSTSSTERALAGTRSCAFRASEASAPARGRKCCDPRSGE